MATIHPHHHHFVDTSSAFVVGLWILMVLAFITMLQEAAAVLTNLPRMHY